MRDDFGYLPWNLILKFPNSYVAISKTIDVESFKQTLGPQATIIPSGALVTFDDRDIHSKARSSLGGDLSLKGILLGNIDMTTDAIYDASVLIQGYIDINQIPMIPTEEQMAMVPLIKFLD